MNVVFRKVGFVALFIGLVLLSDFVTLSKIWGDGGTFTAFQFLGPLPGAFLGTGLGVIVVLFAELIRYALAPSTLDFWTVARFFPMLFAVVYFAQFRGKFSFWVSLIPILCMVAFVMTPVGAQAWYYSLFWLIPPICALFYKVKPLIFTVNLGGKMFGLALQSLGTTFTAHAIGSVAFMYAFMTAPYNTPEFWTTLMPVVVVERLAFALGIGISFLGMNYLLDRLFSKSSFPTINKDFVGHK
ncbi:MAG: hypothetical protein ACP5NX_01705 [Candidatus Bilamarchaeaceae archaeon]